MAVVNREYIEKMIYDVFNELDPTGKNTTKYKDMLSTLDAKEFEKYMKEFLADDEEQFVLDIVEFETKLTLDQCEKAAKVIGVPLMERVFLPHLTMDKNNVIVTSDKCLVGYINTKRTQQLLHKKNALATSNERTSALTGQVIGDDKNTRDSDIEAAMLISLGADKVLQEFHGPRADDVVMRRQMRQRISDKGYVMLEELDSDPRNKTTLNTLGVYLLTMGLEHDLLGESYLLPRIENYS